MTIKIEDGIDDLTAISLVKQVIEYGVRHILQPEIANSENYASAPTHLCAS